MSDAIQEYLNKLANELGSGRRLRRRVRREIQAHLNEAVLEAGRQGFSAHEAERRALERLGPPELVAARFAEELPGRSTLKRAFVASSAMALAGAIAAVALLVPSESRDTRRSPFPVRGDPFARVFPHHPRLLADLTKQTSVDPTTVRVVAQAPAAGVPEGRVVLLAGRGSGGQLHLAPYVFSGGGSVLVGQGFSSVTKERRPFFDPAVTGENMRPGQWQVIRASPAASRPPVLSYFEALGGRRDRAVRWATLVGVTRRDVGTVLMRFADGTRRAIAVRPRHSFAYSSGSPAAFPTALEAYGPRGRLQGRVPVVSPLAICERDGELCGPAKPPPSSTSSFSVSFFQLKPTQTAHPGEHIVVSRILGTPSRGTGYVPLSANSYPLHLYLVRNSDAPAIRSVHDPRLIPIGTMRPLDSDLRFVLPNLKSGSYAVAASCDEACAKATKGKGLFVLKVGGGDFGGAPTPVMLLHVRSPGRGSPWFPVALGLGGAGCALALVSLLLVARRRRKRVGSAWRRIWQRLSDEDAVAGSA